MMDFFHIQRVVLYIRDGNGLTYHPPAVRDYRVVGHVDEPDQMVRI